MASMLFLVGEVYSPQPHVRGTLSGVPVSISQQFPEEYQMSFKKHMKDLCMAPTEEEYLRIMIALRFICGEGNLLTWLEWWNA